jgi:anti-sigma B factor antagonist
MNHLSVDVVDAGGAAVIWPVGQLDVTSTSLWQEALASVMAPGGSVIVDLSRLTFIDSAGLSSLSMGRRTALRLGCRFSVRGARGAVAQVLEQTGLWTILQSGGK